MSQNNALYLTYYFLPWIKYQSIGTVSVFSVFGLKVYQSVGDVKSLLGYGWRTNG